MSRTNAVWGVVKEHCPGEERPGSATEAELWSSTVMTILELWRLCRLDWTECSTAVEPDSGLCGLQ